MRSGGAEGNDGTARHGGVCKGAAATARGEGVGSKRAAFVCATAHQGAERCTKEILATVAMPCPGVEDVLGRGCSPALLAEQRDPSNIRQGLTLKYAQGRGMDVVIFFYEMQWCAAIWRAVRKRAGRRLMSWRRGGISQSAHQMTDQGVQLKGQGRRNWAVGKVFF